MFIDKLSNLHNQKELLEIQADQILTKYGLILNHWTPKAQIKESTNAFNKMCDLGIRVYPIEQANNEAIEDYRNWHKIQLDIGEILTKSSIIGMKMKGFTDTEIKNIFHYKESVNLDEFIN